jgi:hypothetical protein
MGRDSHAAGARHFGCTDSAESFPSGATPSDTRNVLVP